MVCVQPERKSVSSWGGKALLPARGQSGVPIVCRQHCSDSGDGSINGEIVVGTSAHGRISASLPSLASHLLHVLPEILIKRIGPSSCRKTALRARGWDSGRISAERSLRHSDSATSDGGLRHRGITRAEYRKVRTSTSHPWIRETSDTAEGSHLVARHSDFDRLNCGLA